MAENKNIYLDAYNSVVNYLQSAVEDMRLNGYSDTLEFKNIDGHAEDAVLPNVDFVFIKDFSGNIEEHFRYWVFAVGVSTVEDENMFRHRKILSYLLDRLVPLTTIDLYDSETLKHDKGCLVIRDDVTVSPFSKYNTRAVQFLLVDVSSTETTHEGQLLDHTLDPIS